MKNENVMNMINSYLTQDDADNKATSLKTTIL